jgi:hypothetical protein
MLLALLLLLAQAIVRAGGAHMPRLSAIIADLVPSPLALVLAFWLGVVLLACTDTARSWLAAIGITQLLFGLGALLQTAVFVRYLREAALLPTLTVGATRGQVFSLTVLNSVLGCALGMWLAHIFAPWAGLRPRIRRHKVRWVIAAIAGSILALVAVGDVHGTIWRLSAAVALSLGGRWTLDVGLTAIVVLFCALIGGVVGWALARGAGTGEEPNQLHALPTRYA